MKIELDVEEYTNRINESYKQGFKDGVESCKENQCKGLSDSYNPKNNTSTGDYKPMPVYYSSGVEYEKAPYWMNPNFKMPEVSCKFSPTTTKWGI